jgi:hypothetical protein
VTAPLSARFEANVIPEPMSGCHLWTGTASGFGHGRIRVNGKREAAHRVAWAIAYGSVPAGKKVLHSCDNPACVNVLHLHLGDDFDNMREMVVRGRSPNKAKTHCPQGHPYDAKNTKLVRGRFSPRRQCRTCNREISARCQRRKAERGAA